MLKKTKRKVQYIIANEAGASVYSASKLGAFAACAVCRVKRKHNFSADGRLQKKLFEVFAKNANSRFLCLFRQVVPDFALNEAGASVYSASKLGAEEFPEYDVSLRSAVSSRKTPLADSSACSVRSFRISRSKEGAMSRL